MPEKVVFILSTSRTGTKTLAEGLRGKEIESPHQPPFSRFLTIGSNYYLNGWIPKPVIERMVTWLREPQIFGSDSRYYIQVYSLDHLPSKIISQRHPNVYVVHIIRDPRSFVCSYLNWMRTRFRSFAANKVVVGWHPSGCFTGEIPWRKWCRMDEFQRVCWHWKYKNSLLEHLFEGEANYIRIRFEDLFSKKGEQTLRSMLAFVDIPFHERFLGVLRAKKNVSAKRYFPRWENWQPKRQQQLLEICGDLMIRYGYLKDEIAGDETQRRGSQTVPV